MSIPIDKLYHYIEGIAKEIRDDIVIYRFYPHGSKKLEDLRMLSNLKFGEHSLHPVIYCNDQEPLQFSEYANKNFIKNPVDKALLNKYSIARPDYNLKIDWSSIYDKSLLLHSEKQSADITLYKNHNFVPVYYWSHGIIALDWFRYAQYETINKTPTKNFLIYNRAWSSTREYRLKFVELIVKHNLIDKCQTTFSPVEPQLNIHYSQHKFTNIKFTPDCVVDNLLPLNTADASASADYILTDYLTTDFEVVLETLFDDRRLHLTEKILRPIALGQPFLLAATCGSLEYLRSYGFRTFASIIDESYDTIEDPVLRLEAIVRAMKEIASWTESERTEKIAIANQIAMYNRKHFFSGKFFNIVTDELRTNLKAGLEEIESTNTSTLFLNRRKQLGKYPELVKHLLSKDTRENMLAIVKKARSYYRRTIPKD